MLDIAGIAWWLVQAALVPDSYSRICNRLGSRNEYKRLVASVRDDVGIRPGRAYSRWLSKEETWEKLVQDTDSCRIDLTESLNSEMNSTLHFPPWATPSAGEQLKRAEQLVEATLSHLIPSLDAPNGLAVVESRLRHEIRDVKELIQTSQHIDERLNELPPGAAEAVRALLGADSQIAARILELLVSPRAMDSLKPYADTPPNWLANAPLISWVALAEFAQAHQDYQLASRLFEHVAELGLEGARYLALAALHAARTGDQERTLLLLDRARNIDASARVVTIISAGIEENIEILAEQGRHLDELSVPEVAFVAEGLRLTKGPNAAIEFYRRALRRFPMYSGLLLQLAALLAEQQNPRWTYRSSALREARELALRCRDLRRSWKGPSREAVAALCRIEMISGKYREVLSIGLPEPDGHATLEEASDPAVVSSVIDAAIAVGDIELARRLLPRITNEFDRVCLSAQVLASDNNRSEAKERYNHAWTLVASEEDKLSVWFGLAALGEDLPDIEALDTRDDEISAAILALRDLNSGHTDEGIARLRQWRNRSPRVVELLASALIRKGDIETAADVFEDAAQRFDDPFLLVSCAVMLASHELYDRAESVAARALTVVGRDPGLRVPLHEVLIAAAQHRQAWHEMESYSRALIDEQGITIDRKWLLAGSLYNQRQFSEAWEVLGADASQPPDIEDRARVWMDLSLKFQPGPGLADELLALVQKFHSSTEFVAAAIGSFFLMDKSEEISADTAQRWQNLLKDFTEQHPGHPGLQSIKIPDDPENLAKALEPFLKQDGLNINELAQKVANSEMPYGMLSVATGKPYCVVLVQRGAGCIPMRPTATEMLRADLADALQSRNKTVVIDTSTLVVLSLIRQHWPMVLSSFSRIVFPGAGRNDLVRAVGHYELRSSGTLGWDYHENKPAFTEADDDLRTRLLEQARWILDKADDLVPVHWPIARHFPGHREFGSDERFLTWISALDYAIDRDLALMCDDLTLRNIARELGVRTFGTSAFLESLSATGNLEAEDVDSAYETLCNEYCVDLPLSLQSLIRIAEQDGWLPESAAFFFSRPAAWLDGAQAFNAWRTVCERVAAHEPQAVAGWLYAAVLGTGRLRAHYAVAGVAAELLAAATLISADNTELFPALVASARSGTAELGGSDPLPMAVKRLLAAITASRSARDAALAVLILAHGMSEADRSIIRQIVFSGD